MKKGILVLLLITSVFANAQTLKEALFSGKLKNDAGTVIRKGDDLSSKMDTTTHKAAPDETSETAATLPAVDSSTNTLAPQTDSATGSITDKNETSTGSAAIVAAPAAAAATAAAAPKNNNAILKEYMDSVVSTLTAEALSSKKVKRGSYFVLITYAIGTDGQVEFSDVALTPENSYLQQQIKDRLAVDTPRLSPVLNSAGTPRKAIKKYNFTLTKE